jgi:hypothetical protein
VFYSSEQIDKQRKNVVNIPKDALDHIEEQLKRSEKNKKNHGYEDNKTLYCNEQSVNKLP